MCLHGMPLASLPHLNEARSKEAPPITWLPDVFDSVRDRQRSIPYLAAKFMALRCLPEQRRQDNTGTFTEPVDLFSGASPWPI